MFNQGTKSRALSYFILQNKKSISFILIGKTNYHYFVCTNLHIFFFFQKQQYIAIGNFEPKSEEELQLSEGMVVELLDGFPNQEYWVVRVLLDDEKTGPEGLVPSAYLELLGEVIDEGDKEKHKSLEHRQ